MIYKPTVERKIIKTILKIENNVSKIHTVEKSFLVKRHNIDILFQKREVSVCDIEFCDPPPSW